MSDTEYHWAAGPNDAGTWVIHGRRTDGALNSAVILVYPLTDDDGHDLAPVLVERILRTLTDDRPMAEHPCGAQREWKGQVATCDLPGGHTDEVHQASNWITWRPDGTVL